MRRHARAGVPTTVEVRQRGDAITFVIGGLAANAQRRLVAQDISGLTSVTESRDGLSFELDLDALARAGGGPWEITLREGSRRVEWRRARWTWDVARTGDGDGARPHVTLRSARGQLMIDSTAGGILRVSDVSVRASRSHLRVAGKVAVAPQQVASVQVALVRRGDEERREVPTNWRVAAVAGPATSVEFEARIPWQDAVDDASHDMLDAEISVTNAAGEQFSMRVAGAKGWRRLLPSATGKVVTERGTTWFSPRTTFKAHTLAIYAHTLPPDAAAELARLTRFRRLRRLFGRGRGGGARPLWLIGELPYKAQDTGLALFAHVVRAHPDIDARYVIAANSPDAARASALGPVVFADTAEHVRAVIGAHRIIGSHHPDYLFPLRTPWMRRRIAGARVFLQHGIMGTKWMTQLYGAEARGFEADQVHVSSPSERRMLIRDFGYSAARVVVTGLTRFDELLAPSEPGNQVLVIPTWRDWIFSDQDFAESEFLEQWSGLLADHAFATAVDGREVVVVLHPNMRNFSHRLAGPGLRIVRQGEASVQELIRSAELVVTDYSSVGFDAAILGRSVVYFQFDRERFLGPGGSHLDLDRDLPGRVAVNRQAAVAAVADAIATGSEQFGERVHTFFPAADRQSAERATQAIRLARRPRFAESRRRLRIARGIVSRRLARGRTFAPVARLVMCGARLLPLRDNVVVFAAQRGRTYADSPRAIYRELCRTHPEMTKVWAIQGGVPDGDDRTSTVEPDSFAHVWALARARFWVSDQSQHPAVRRRKGQEFVQTWHGTPIKRMLHDAKLHEGRDAGYVDRATRSAAQWSILLSPNSHATAALESAFRHQARVLELGSPRNDVFAGTAAAGARARMRTALGASAGQSVVLFAPTFRDRALGAGDAIAPTAFLDYEKFCADVGDDVLLVVRRHFLDTVAGPISPHLKGKVVDATTFADMNELLTAVDVLITDFSSSCFDFLCTQRPIVFFAPDLADFTNNTRGLYLDIADFPGPVTTSYDELAPLVREALSHGRIAGYDLAGFRATYCGADDGYAARRAVEAVFAGNGAA